LVIRLSHEGLLESQWQEPDTPGKLTRHVYTLTPNGLTFAPDGIAREVCSSSTSGRGSYRMSSTPSVPLRVAFMERSAQVLPSARSPWAESMRHKIHHIESHLDAPNFRLPSDGRGKHSCGACKCAK
jgi:hypothetical protein